MKKQRWKGVAVTPIVMQLEALECGAASLTMILAYHGKWLPLEQVRLACGVSRDGSNAKNIVKAAQNYGLQTKAYRYGTDELRSKGTFPCIIHWEYNHFVVLNGFKKDKAVINDPAKGRYEISMKAFTEAYTGIALFFEPGEGFVKGGKPKSVLEFAKNRLKGAGGAFTFTLVTTAITSILGLLFLAASQVFLDRILPGRESKAFTTFIAVLIGLAFIQLCVAWVQAVCTFRIRGKLAAEGSTSYLWKVLRMPMEFFAQRRAGDLQQRHLANAEIANTFVTIFSPLILNSCMMLVYLFVMLGYSPSLTVLSLISIMANLAVSMMVSKKKTNLVRVQMRDKGNLAGMTVSGIDMIETIKANGAENGFFEKWAGCQADVNRQTVKYEKLNLCMGSLPEFIMMLTNVMILVLGVQMTIKGTFTVGGILVFQGLFQAFMTPVNSLITAGQKLQEMRGEMERVEDVMQYPLDENYGSDEMKEGVEYQKLSGQIELNHVTFGYAKLEAPLIEDFSLSMQPGSKVAIVGASGCGKSTLSKLLSGLYVPWSGEILFDGKPIREIDRAVFTGSLAVVDQDIVLFEDTIANNIKMWDSSIEDFEMIMAARDAKIHEEIMQRDGGYHYRMMENGKDFSGGQRQRLEIARVLAQDPTIVILDEATSALDAKTEFEVVNSIKDRGITCIVIAHRLSTVRDCDEIIVLRHGKVVERGTHDELIQKGGYYLELISND